MKTILVDAVDAFVVKKLKMVLRFLSQCGKCSMSSRTERLFSTGANDEQFKKFGLDKMPYEVFTLKHNPEKTDPRYYETMLKKLDLKPESVVYFEHNPDAIKSAQSVGIKTYFLG